MARFTALLAVLICLAGPAVPQANVDPLTAGPLLAPTGAGGAAPTSRDTENARGGVAQPDRVAEYLAGRAGAGEDPGPDAALLGFLDEDGTAALTSSLAAYYRYRETGFAHRRAVFDWQLLSSKVIFGMVNILVLAGLYFSYVQFMIGIEAARAQARAAEQGKPATTEPEGAGQTTFEATLQGIKVSSPIIGVVILVISLAFFYLYLVHVYPINEI